MNSSELQAKVAELLNSFEKKISHHSEKVKNLKRINLMLEVYILTLDEDDAGKNTQPILGILICFYFSLISGCPKRKKSLSIEDKARGQQPRTMLVRTPNQYYAYQFANIFL